MAIHSRIWGKSCRPTGRNKQTNKQTVWENSKSQIVTNCGKLTLPKRQKAREIEIAKMSKSTGKFKFHESCSEYHHFIHFLCFSGLSIGNLRYSNFRAQIGIFLDRYQWVIWSFPSKLSLAINADFAKLGNTKCVQTIAFMVFIVKPTEPWQNL